MNPNGYTIHYDTINNNLSNKIVLQVIHIRTNTNSPYDVVITAFNNKNSKFYQLQVLQKQTFITLYTATPVADDYILLVHNNCFGHKKIIFKIYLKNTTTNSSSATCTYEQELKRQIMETLQ